MTGARIHGEWLTFDTPVGVTEGYLVRPLGSFGPLPGVLVLQELWGVDEHIIEVTEQFGTAGYVALAPDLNSRGGGRPTTLSPERIISAINFLDASSGDYESFVNLLVSPRLRTTPLQALSKHDADQIDETLIELLDRAGDLRHREVVQAGFTALKAHPSCQGGPVAAVGYCQGGALAARLACDQPDLAAAVVYYGASPPLELVAAMRCSIRGFYGSEDTSIVAGLPAFNEALEAAGINHELRIYPGVLHAFSNDTRPWYNHDATRDAWARTLAYLAERLAPVDSTVVATRPS
jgi:carboxymethylenebutenolidase